MTIREGQQWRIPIANRVIGFMAAGFVVIVPIVAVTHSAKRPNLAALSAYVAFWCALAGLFILLALRPRIVLGARELKVRNIGREVSIPLAAVEKVSTSALGIVVALQDGRRVTAIGGGRRGMRTFNICEAIRDGADSSKSNDGGDGPQAS